MPGGAERRFIGVGHSRGHPYWVALWYLSVCLSVFSFGSPFSFSFPLIGSEKSRVLYRLETGKAGTIGGFLLHTQAGVGIPRDCRIHLFCLLPSVFEIIDYALFICSGFACCIHPGFCAARWIGAPHCDCCSAWYDTVRDSMCIADLDWDTWWTLWLSPSPSSPSLLSSPRGCHTWGLVSVHGQWGAEL